MIFPQYRNELTNALAGVDPEEVRVATEILMRAREQTASVYLLGNGGSASTASHFANDLAKMAGIRAYSVPAMVPLITAYGNDENWWDMYALTLSRLLLPQDVVVAISCSGSSPNVVEAVRTVKESALVGLRVIALLGSNFRCKIAQLEPNACIFVPYRDIRIQEDCHLAICHSIVGALAGAGLGKKSKGSV